MRLLPDFPRYRKYLGVNKTDKTAQFCDEVLRKIFSSGCMRDIQKIQKLISILENDPLYNFMEDHNFTKSEKDGLYKILWENKYIQSFAEILSIPDSLKSQKI